MKCHCLGLHCLPKYLFTTIVYQYLDNFYQSNTGLCLLLYIAHKMFKQGW